MNMEIVDSILILQHAMDEYAFSFINVDVYKRQTNDSSFLVRPVKVIIKDNRYYIVDEGIKIEKPLPEGQLSIFDLFNVQNMEDLVR